jgi:hypothetical protein
MLITFHKGMVLLPSSVCWPVRRRAAWKTGLSALDCTSRTTTMRCRSRLFDDHGRWLVALHARPSCASDAGAVRQAISTAL